MRGPDQPPKPTGDPDPRARPAIQTDPDLTIQTDPDLTIQTYDPDFFKVLKSITLYYKVLLQYYFVLQSTTLYYKVRCWVISWILEKFGHPVPDLVPDRSRPVPDQFHGIQGQCPFTAMLPSRQNRSVRPVQNHLVQFKSYMKWLSWFQALRSRRAEKTFYESGRSRRPDHRGTIQTRLSTHSHICFIHTNAVNIGRIEYNIYIYMEHCMVGGFCGCQRSKAKPECG